MTLERVVAVATGKGGTGKTSVTTNVAGLAAAAGWKTLVIDADPQGNVGHDLGYGWAGHGDGGHHLTTTLITGGTLEAVLTDVRPNLDVVPGGAELDTLEDVILSEERRGGPGTTRLRHALATVAGEYDLILIDTPPSRHGALVHLALTAARWVIVPTKSDRSSIEGLRVLGDQIAKVRAHNPDLEVLGAVLFGSGSAATVTRSNALDDITAVLGGAADLFESVIRHTESAAVDARNGGQLVHELADAVFHAEPWWKAIQEGRRPARVQGSAPALAEDYLMLTKEILDTITVAESQEVSA